MTTLSVIVPVHNGAQHLPAALASLRRNDAPGVQVIVVDDASTDTTPDLLATESGGGRWADLRVVRTPAPVGAAAARNVGLDRADGRLITFFDADDWLAPGHLADLVAAVDGLGCDFVRTDHVQVRGRSRVLHRAPCVRDVVLDPRAHIMPVQRETMVDYPFSWAGVYRRELGDVLRFPEGLHTATDRPWIWRLHREAASFATVSLAGLFYRREVEGSLTRIGDARRLHLFDAYALVLDQVRDEHDIRPKAVRQFVALLAWHVQNLDVYDAAARAGFGDRARRALAELGPELRAAGSMTAARRELLAPYWPAGVTVDVA